MYYSPKNQKEKKVGFEPATLSFVALHTQYANHSTTSTVDRCVLKIMYTVNSMNVMWRNTIYTHHTPTGLGYAVFLFWKVLIQNWDALWMDRCLVTGWHDSNFRLFD